MNDSEEIRIALGNLPPDITEEDVLEELEHLGFEMRVYLERMGNADRVTAVIIIEGLTRNAAEALAAQLNGMPYRDRFLKAYVPLFLA